MNRLIPGILGLLVAGPLSAADATATRAIIEQYLEGDIRDAAEVARDAFNALHPGGIYGAVDHTRRHMQPTNRAVGRRLDPVQIIKEMQDVGFEFVDYSTMHYHPEDDLTQEVGTPGVQGNTDRFTLKFRKP